MRAVISLLIGPVNTFLVFRANAKAGTRPALAHAACRRAEASLPRINPTYLWTGLIIRPVNALLVFRANAKAGTGPAFAHAVCRRAGASLPRINPADLWAGLIICLAACVFAAPAFATADDDDKPSQEPPKSAPASGNSTTLSLNPKIQQLAGIKTQPLKAAEQQPEFTAYGTVLSLEPLLQQRQQYLAARTQQDSAKARYTEAHLNLSRTKDLHDQDIVSTRRLQEQQAQWQADKANLEASGYQQQTILAASRLEWGDTLTDWFIQTQGKAAEQFLNHRAQLLQVTLPANAHLSPAIRSIHIDEHGQRHRAILATLISASPRIDPVSQGERYFFKVEGRHIPFGAHVTAWIASDTKQTAGVFVPESALVWHLGQAFVFIKTADDEFSRRALPEFTAANRGYFVTGSLQAGEEIVTAGAQTLLSQELKSLIPSEDDD